MRLYLLLLLILGLWLGALPASARAEEERGHAGIFMVRQAGEDFFTVDYVAQDGPAARVGIAVGDRVTALGGSSTKGMTLARCNWILGRAVGTPIKITVARDGLALDCVMVLATDAEAYGPAAEAGDVWAQCHLGDYYAYGPASARDYAKALPWYRQAAEAGDAGAQVALGNLYYAGHGVAKDLPASFTWYQKAAAQGNVQGERNLANAYLYGLGVAQNDAAGFAWSYAAAEQDDPISERRLGFLYAQGRGVAKDVAAAFAWYYQAAERGDAYGAWNLARCYEHGRGTAQDDALAARWYGIARLGLPEDRGLRMSLAGFNLNQFFKGKAPLDRELLRQAYGAGLMVIFGILVGVYLIGGGVLLWFTLRRAEGVMPWGLALGWFAFFLESQAVALGAISALARESGGAIFLGVTMAVSSLPIIASSCGPLRRRFWRVPVLSPGQAALYFGGGLFAVWVVFTGYDKAYEMIFHLPLPKQGSEAIIRQALQASAWITYLGIAVLAPAAEEVLFRGYLFDAARKWLPPLPTVVVTGALFAAIHFDKAYFLPLFTFGLVLGWARHRTDSLWVGFAIHACNNAFCLLALRFS